MTRRRKIVFWLANASVAIFFDCFWLLGYRINALDNLSSEIGYFQFVLWFVSFFMVSFLSLKAIIKKGVIIKCLGIALAFSFLLSLTILISTIILAPYIDPMY